MSIHTHHAHTHTLQSCLLTQLLYLPPFFPYLGVGGTRISLTLSQQPLLLSSISPCLSPSLTRHCRHLEWGIAPNTTAGNCRPATPRNDKIGFRILSADCVFLIIPRKSDVKLGTEASQGARSAYCMANLIQTELQTPCKRYVWWLRYVFTDCHRLDTALLLA